jgi:hypothetical protein
MAAITLAVGSMLTAGFNAIFSRDFDMFSLLLGAGVRAEIPRVAVFFHLERFPESNKELSEPQ